MKRISKWLTALSGLLLIAYAMGTYYLLFIGLLPPWMDVTLLSWVVTGAGAVTLLIGFWLFCRGLFTPPRLPALTATRNGGSVSITAKALKNITYTAVERFEGVLEDRAKVRILRRGGSATYRVKVWLGIAEYSTLPQQHEAVRQAVAEALYACTGLECERIDLIFYSAAVKAAEKEDRHDTE